MGSFSTLYLCSISFACSVVVPTFAEITSFVIRLETSVFKFFSNTMSLLVKIPQSLLLSSSTNKPEIPFSDIIVLASFIVLFGPIV